jgi:hypothetical protein
MAGFCFEEFKPVDELGQPSSNQRIQPFFPINKPHDLAVIHNTIGLGKVILHKAQVGVGFSVGKDNLSFQGIGPAVT